MANLNSNNPPQLWSLRQSLSDATTANWGELMPAQDRGLIHIEFYPGVKNPIDSLVIWSSIARGYWTRVCDYVLGRGEDRASRMRFSGTYASASFAEALEVILQHQARFQFDEPQYRTGLIQVYPPMAQ